MRSRRRHILLVLAVVLALVPAAGTAAAASTLRAGVAVVDITPENGGTTLGYVRPDIMMEGIGTRLTGRALVLADGDTKVALLSTDLAYALDKESLVSRLADRGFTHATILYTGTHTHSGPESLSDWQLAQLADAIRRADDQLTPVVAGWGTATVDHVNRNRSIEAHLADHGMDLFYGQGSPTADPAGPDHTRDRTLRVLRVDRTDGTPLAAWTEFPVHLTASTPYNKVWSADIAGPAMAYLAGQVHSPGFVGLFTNGNQGDMTPIFDSYNPPSVMDLDGRRVAAGAFTAWQRASRHLSGDVPVDVRWTKSCYCGQIVEGDKRIAPAPFFGISFFGGSEDGASIFHEPLATEGRRRPAALADPVEGRKILAAPAPWDRVPEIQIVRVGDRLMLAAPGEPSVEMGRRFVAAVDGLLPAGVSEAFLVGLANDYLGYLTTPEEYDMQHYEGGHTVFGKYTSLLVRNTFVALTKAMAAGVPAPAPYRPGGTGSTARGNPTVGTGTAAGTLVAAPSGAAQRMTSLTLRWSGSRDGVDRPLGSPFLTLERRDGDTWHTVDTDLGIRFLWTEQNGTYTAHYDIPPNWPAGTYRLRVHGASYTLDSGAFRITPSHGLRVRGATLATVGGRTVLRFVAQNPPPDPDVSVLARSSSPRGGSLTFAVAGRVHTARWSDAAGGWVAAVPGLHDGDTVDVLSGGLVDGLGNTSGGAVTLTVGEVRPIEWPPDIGTGGGRAPGPLGEGSFPP